MDNEGAGVGAKCVVERDNGQTVEPSSFGGDQPLGRVLRVDSKERLRPRIQPFFCQTYAVERAYEARLVH